MRRVVLAVAAALIVTGAALWGIFSGGFGVVGGQGGRQGSPGPVAARLDAAGPAPDMSGAVRNRVAPQMAWVAVPVATVWVHPATSRPEDADGVGARPDVARWLRTLTYQQKLGFDDLLDTQLLLDQMVMVVGRSGAWSEVSIPQQTGAAYPHGIDGWVPTAQISTTAPPAGQLVVTVAAPTLPAGGLVLSYGTDLPARRGPGVDYTLLLPSGPATVPPTAVRASRLTAGGQGVVSEARRFMGLQYLWAGTSAFGFDCSGLTYTVYRQFGVTLPRDAADQAQAGHPVAEADLRPGDLVFFAFEPIIDHVGIYAGHGMVIDAPETGRPIEEVPLSTLQRWYAGGRRYLNA